MNHTFTTTGNLNSKLLILMLVSVAMALGSPMLVYAQTDLIVRVFDDTYWDGNYNSGVDPGESGLIVTVYDNGGNSLVLTDNADGTYAASSTQMALLGSDPWVYEMCDACSM